MLEGRLGERPERARRRRRPPGRDAGAPRRGPPPRHPAAQAARRGARPSSAALLRERYMGGRPDFVTVVLHADGFPQLLETLQFVQARRARRHARCSTSSAPPAPMPDREQRVLRDSPSAGEREADAVRTRRDALAEITPGLRERQATRSPAPTPPASPRSAAPAAVAARPSASSAACSPPAPAPPRSLGPGGPWAIPWPIVQCESGGQNLPPNYAGASGYYQFMRRDLEGPRRLDPARLPGLQGRAGPPRRAPVGRRRGPRTTGSARRSSTA